ncbi:MAG TPA: citrate lyase subunit alpha [Anaeromyxobacteraceae bacterium]|nr:citrate lyase subunit alpha [Anaeromyxobacteraceae bacterium]
MTRFDASRRSVLSARDARQADIDARLGAGWPALVAASLGLPGERKAPPGSGALFAWAVGRLARAFPEARRLHAEIEAITGKPRPLEFDDKVVALIEYRDGSIIDAVRRVRE